MPVRYCHVCEQHKETERNLCGGKPPIFTIQRCPHGSSQCYTLITNQYKFRRGCVSPEEEQFQLCKDNLFEDCRICDFNKCNADPIMLPMSNNCTQCTTDCDMEIPVTSCGHLTQLQTETSQCYTKFDATGQLTEKGCLTQDIHATVGKDEILLTCNEYACNALSPAHEVYCYNGEDGKPDDCREAKVSQFPGCYILYDGKSLQFHDLMFNHFKKIYSN